MSPRKRPSKDVSLPPPVRTASARYDFAPDDDTRAAAVEDLIQLAATRFSGGRPRSRDREKARRVWLRERKEGGKIEAAIQAVMAECGCSRKHVFEMRRDDRWPNKAVTEP